GGDIEWRRPVFASGREVAYDPDVQVAHPARESLTELIRRARRVAAGMLQGEQARPAKGPSGLLKVTVPHSFFSRRILTARKVRGPLRRGLLLGLNLGLR